MTTRRNLLGLSTLFLAAACAGSEPPPAPPPPPPPPVAASAAAPTQATAPPAASEAAKPEPPKEEKPAAPVPVVRYTEGIAAPESVLYDEARDRYLVSNINGSPFEADNNGYIMELSPDGKVTNPKFVAAGVNKVKLDAPKGMAIANGILYVSDITVVRKFDAKSGAPKGEIAVPGSTFLNDVAAAPDGRIFVSDSAVKPGKDGFESTGNDAVYVIEKGKVKPLAKSKELAGPNGLLFTPKGLLVVALMGNELYRLDDKGARQDVTKLPQGGLDGIAAAGDTLLVTSWQASAIYRGTLGGTFELFLPEQKSPADIAVDTKRNRVLVPHLMGNAVEAYDIK